MILGLFDEAALFWFLDTIADVLLLKDSLCSFDSVLSLLRNEVLR